MHLENFIFGINHLDIFVGAKFSPKFGFKTFREIISLIKKYKFFQSKVPNPYKSIIYYNL